MSDNQSKTAPQPGHGPSRCEFLPVPDSWLRVWPLWECQALDRGSRLRQRLIRGPLRQVLSLLSWMANSSTFSNRRRADSRRPM